ncbi:alpha/beta fold hydrolase [Streptomyces sp. NPDC000345]|uniref:alpha/beta fold hydrolase n=1 Tax=Streptomyces sp. NPDC000345 TaxID=3364537 RepID=UPI0036A3136B
MVQWSVEFGDRARAPEPAGRMADPWFGINPACSRALDEERERAWGTPGPKAACRALAVPVPIVDGARDIRPRSAVDSLARALPEGRRLVLPDAGHLPWAEEPGRFREAVISLVRGV